MRLRTHLFGGCEYLAGVHSQCFGYAVTPLAVKRQLKDPAVRIEHKHMAPIRLLLKKVFYV
jgi:hypothetical protein